MSLVSSSWPHSLDTATVDNQSPAVAETARILAGRARWLYEMATGESGDSAESPIIPVNPQGLYGVDHSGPPYGVALRHGVIHGGRSIDPTRNSTHWTDADRDTVADGGPLTVQTVVWVKPHVDGVGPYAYGYLDFVAARVGGSTVTVTATVENISAGQESASGTLAITSGASINEFAGTSVKVPMVSGWNRIRVTFEADGTAYIAGWSINQVNPFRDD